LLSVFNSICKVTDVQLRYNFRLYPNGPQRAALARAFGCARVVFNDALRAREEARAASRPYVSSRELSRRLTAAKRTPGRAWPGDVSAVVLQQSLRDLDAAYRSFFDGLMGKRPKTGPLRFKSRKDRRQAVRFTANARWKITPGGDLSLPKIGDVRVKWSRALPSAPATVTVVKDSAGRYFASFVVDASPETLPEVTTEVGIDLGLTHFAVLSDGTKIDSPRFLRRAEKKLRRAQQAFSRKAKGSKNREKARLRVARAKFGREFHRIGRFEPTSRVCSACGMKDGPKPLRVRVWTCGACGATLDRDTNAAVNIGRAAGLAVTACRARERPECVPARRGEAGTHRDGQQTVVGIPTFTEGSGSQP
jgi:putative transposase